ncbi:MAG: hypothetical protein V3S69_02885 [Dehalococcoidales bacterium]
MSPQEASSSFNYLNAPPQIPGASAAFLQGGQNPNTRNFPPGEEPKYTNPLLQMMYNVPGAAMKGIGGGISSLANMLGKQMVRPEMAIRENVADNTITRANQRIADAIAAQTQ